MGASSRASAGKGPGGHRSPLALALMVAGAAIVAAPAGPSDGALRIGLIETTDPLDRAVADGAAAAVAEVNRRGGVGGLPVALLRMPAPRPWLDGAGPMARLTFGGEVTALIGPADGAAAHLAAQIATRGRIPLLTPSPEASLTRAFVPWIFRGVPDDREQALALLRWSAPLRGDGPVALVVPPGREGRERAASLREACRELSVAVSAEIRGEPGPEDAGASAGTDTVLLWLDAGPSLSFLRALPAGRAAPLVLASLRLDEPAVLRQVPASAPTLALPLLRPRAGAEDRRRASAAPVGARLGRDMVGAILSAARREGIAPRAIRDALAGGAAIRGETGSFAFDARGNRVGRVEVGVLRDGLLVPANGQPPASTSSSRNTLVRGEPASEPSTGKQDEARHGP